MARSWHWAAAHHRPKMTATEMPVHARLISAFIVGPDFLALPNGSTAMFLHVTDRDHKS